MPLAWAQRPMGDDRWHQSQALIRWKECAEITARPGQGWQERGRAVAGLAWGEAGPGSAAQSSASRQAGESRVYRAVRSQESFPSRVREEEGRFMQ